MKPSEAAIKVAEELEASASYNLDRIEVEALDTTAKAFRNFAELLEKEEE